MSQLEENKATIERFVDVANRKEFQALDDLVAENFVRHCQATPDIQVRSREDFKRFAEEDAKAFPDSEVTVEFMFGEGDLVAIHGTFTGTQNGPMGPFPPSGERMTAQVEALFRVEGGKIAELWITWDNLAVLAQLGHISPPTVDASG